MGRTTHPERPPSATPLQQSTVLQPRAPRCRDGFRERTAPDRVQAEACVDALGQFRTPAYLGGSLDGSAGHLSEGRAARCPTERCRREVTPIGPTADPAYDVLISPRSRRRRAAGRRFFDSPLNTTVGV